MSDKFRVSPLHVLPEILAIIISGLIAYQMRVASVQVEAITVFPETPSGATLNTGIFVVLMAGAATFMYFLVKFGLKRIVRYLITVALFAVVIFLVNWYGFILADMFRPVVEVMSPPWIAAALILSALLLLGVYWAKGVPHVVAIAVVGALTGTFLGVSVPTLTAVVLLIGLAVYDVFAVYKGPIGKMAQSTEIEDFTGAVFSYGDLTVGMGDMVFYSMLVGHAMINFGVIPYLGAALGVTVGAYLGFKMLEGRDMFPGLPFAIGLGLALMLALSQLLPLFRI